MSDFGYLRSLTQGAPSPKRWEELCASLDPWRGQEDLYEIILPYLHGALRHWPDAMCVAPREWIERALEGVAMPQLVIARSLNLQGQWLGTRGATRLAQTHSLVNLRILQLYGNKLEADGLRALLSTPRFEQVHTLNLFSNDLRSQGASTLAELSNFKGLRHFGMSHNQIRDYGFVALIACPWFEQLESLRLEGNSLGVASMTALAQLERSALVSLEIGSNPILIKGAQALARAPALRGLRVLDLTSAQIQDEGLMELLDSEHFDKIERWGLAYNRLTDKAALGFAQREQTRHVRALNLFGNRITDQGAIELSRSPYIKELTELRLELNAIGADGAAALQRAHPETRHRLGEIKGWSA